MSARSDLSRAASGDLEAVPEPLRTELEGRVADAERRAVEAQAMADERVDQQRRECEARIQEMQRKSEEEIEAERNACEARVAAAERRLEAAEERAVNAEKMLNKAGPGSRAARKVAEARQALEEDRARRPQLEARIRELEATLERERAENTSRLPELSNWLKEVWDEHAEQSDPMEQEDRRDTELARAEEVRRRQLEAAERFGSGQPPSPAAEARPPESSIGAGPSKRWRLRRRASLRCAVCHQERPALSDAQLTERGWALSKSGALCDRCHEDGWRFPAGAAVPFRPAPDRAPPRPEANDLQASDSSRTR